MHQLLVLVTISGNVSPIATMTRSEHKLVEKNELVRPLHYLWLSTTTIPFSNSLLRSVTYSYTFASELYATVYSIFTSHKSAPFYWHSSPPSQHQPHADV
ncbi:hypothetical protein M5689_002680 [Euphorbia peplus]|nr:hypothetical protein M5689_002680 [Euphorbia peplus]